MSTSSVVDSRAVSKKPVRKQTITNRELQKRSVLEVAARLFMERGFAGTSMSDVAEALTISRSTLYYYFESKEQILSSLVEEVTVSINETATDLTSNRRQPDELLHELVQRHVIFIATNGTIYRVLTNSQMFLSDELKAINDAAKEGIFNNFRKVIEQGVETGIFRPVRPGMTALTIIGMCNWVSSWFNSSKALSAEEIGEEIATMAVESIRAPALQQPGRQVRETLAVARLALEKLAGLMDPVAHAGAL